MIAARSALQRSGGSGRVTPSHGCPGRTSRDGPKPHRRCETPASTCAAPRRYRRTPGSPPPFFLVFLYKTSIAALQGEEKKLCEAPLLVAAATVFCLRPRPLLGVKRTWRGLVSMSANGPTPRLSTTPGASGLLWMAPGVLLDWRHCGVDLVVILHHEIDIGREFHGLRGRFQF